MTSQDFLGPILERKRRELARRRRHARLRPAATPALASRAVLDARRLQLEARLRRPAGHLPRVIAEIKRRSPSAGALRPQRRGDVSELARAYEAGGASAISVLCDGPGFGGSPLDLRRASRAVALPVLFKEFVLDALQLELARASGAAYVLLLVRALERAELRELVDGAHALGLAPVVEAANADELAVALETRATIVGVNARDLRTFRVDKAAAQRALAQIPEDRVAVHMSGVRDAADLREIAAGRADAALIGESLMRAPDPAAHLRALLAG